MIWWAGSFPNNLASIRLTVSEKIGFTVDVLATDARVMTVALLCSSIRQTELKLRLPHNSVRVRNNYLLLKTEAVKPIANVFLETYTSFATGRVCVAFELRMF